MGNNSRTTAVLAALAVGISLYAYYFEREPPAWELPLGAVFPGMSHNDVVEIELVPGAAAPEAGAGKVHLRYEPEAEGELPQWRIIEPFVFTALAPRVEGIVDAIIELQRITAVEDPAAAFDPRGPDLTVRFTTRDRPGEWRAIEIGRDNPVPALDLVAVRVGEEVFLTRRRFRRIAAAGLDEMRSREIIPVPKEDAVRLEVRTPDREALVFERSPDSPDWRLFRGPGKSPAGIADRGITAQILDRLNAWRIEAFVDDHAADPSQYGFDRLRLEILLTNRRGRIRRLQVAGGSHPERPGQVLVRDPERPFVFAALPDAIVPLEKPVENFRSLNLIQLGPAEIVAVRGTVYSDGEERRFRLWKEQGAASPAPASTPASKEEASWRVEDQRLGETYTADPETTASFLRQLAAIPIKRNLEEVPPDGEDGGARPLLELELELNGGPKVGVRFLAPPAGVGAGVYLAVREGEPGAALVISGLPGDLRPGGIQFRDRRLSGFPAAAVQEFEIESLGRVWNLARIGGTWRVGEDDHVRLRRDRSLDPLLVQRAVNGLSRENFRAAGFLPDERDDEKLELIPGRYRIRVRMVEVDDHQGFKRLIIGARRDFSPGQESYARVDTVGMPILAPMELVDDLSKLVEHLDTITERPQ